jgi:TPR repeat protein
MTASRLFRSILLLCALIAPAWAQAAPAGLVDNADSIAVVVGNRDYKQTVPVDFAENDAEAIKAFLVGSLGFREQNVFVLKNATLNELNQAFGTERNPQGGRLWRSAVEGKSNVFVYYSGHGAPDFKTRQPFLLPQDGDPNSPESGFALETLYRNLDLVKQKVGADRNVVVMVDACFTGETGRSGESLLAVSAPGFAPAKPRTGGGVIRLAATSGATPANWDQRAKLGLFTSRMLMGAAGLADGADGAKPDGLVSWTELQKYLDDTVEADARRDSGREQIPEVDPSSIILKVSAPVPAIAPSFAAAKDEAAWKRASTAGTREALEAYVGQCGEVCAYRQDAMAKLFESQRSTQALRDAENWRTLSAAGKYGDYLESCSPVCAYRSLAEGYLGRPVTARGGSAATECDDLAAAPNDPDKPADAKGVLLSRIEARAAIAACKKAADAQPAERRFAYQLGRAYDKAERYKDAFASYKAAVDAGSVAAMNNLATLHENGEGTKVSLPDAYKLYVKAAESGNVLAMSNAGRLTEYGRGTTKSVEGAVRWYRMAAEAGDVPSIVKLVPHYNAGTAGLPRDPQKGFDLFKQAAAKGDPSALATMAVLIDNGFGSFFPGEKPIDLLKRALAQGVAGSASISALDGNAQKLKPATVKALQKELGKDEFYTGPQDGKFNPVFVRALDSYAKYKEQQDPGAQAKAAE